MVRIAAAQTPEFLGDVDGALVYASDVVRQAAAEGAQLICFPEAFLQGYRTDPEIVAEVAIDLSEASFADVLRALPQSAPVIVLGIVERCGGAYFNTAAVIRNGVLLGRYRKRHLLKSEQVFSPGEDCPTFTAGGVRFGVNICYDTNFSQAARMPVEAGASLIVCPANNMLPHDIALTWKDRHNEVRSARCRETGAWQISADVTGERANQIALGPTAVIDPTGKVRAQLPLGEPGLLVFDLPTCGSV